MGIEIRECVGDDNIFIFGAKCPEIPEATRRMKEGAKWDGRLVEVVNMIRSGKFGNPVDFEPVLNSIENGKDPTWWRMISPLSLSARRRLTTSSRTRRLGGRNA